MVRVDGIEPTSSAWKAEVLPLNYTRESGSFLSDIRPDRQDLVDSRQSFRGLPAGQLSGNRPFDEMISIFYILPDRGCQGAFSVYSNQYYGSSRFSDSACPPGEKKVELHGISEAR